MALERYERQLVEILRNADFVKVIVNEGTLEETTIKVGGRCPHDIALAIQNHFNEMSKRRQI